MSKGRIFFSLIYEKRICNLFAIIKIVYSVRLHIPKILLTVNYSYALVNKEENEKDAEVRISINKRKNT